MKERPRTVPVAHVKVALPTAPTGVDETRIFFHDLFRLGGLTSAAYRGRALERRVSACLRFLRVKTLDEARRKLATRPELAPPTLSVVLLGVTEFGRDRAVFDQLRQAVILPLAKLERKIRVWSAACSDGRELCSVGILLSEANLLARAELLGTDCRPDAIEMARRGEFPAQSLDKIDDAWRKHFVSLRSGVRPRNGLHESLSWKQADLLAGVETGPWDLILWRNMAIYLEVSVADAVWHKLIPEVAPGGYLVCGKADHPPNHPDLEKLGSCIYRKRQARL